MIKQYREMKDDQNWKRVATKFEDTTEKINDIRNFVPADIVVSVDYADKDNPIIKLYHEGESEPFSQGNVGDYVINDHGNFRIAKIDEFDVAELLK